MKLNNFSTKLTRAPEGEAASAAPAEPVVEPAAAPVEPSSTPPQGPDLSFIGEDFTVDGKPDLEKFRAHYQDLVARDAQSAERVIPESYDLKLGEVDYGDMPLPEGFTVQMDLENEAYQPIVGELTEWMKANGIPQEQAGALTTLLAKYEAAKFSQQYAAERAETANREAELKSLGTPTQLAARLERIERAMGVKLPATQAAALKKAVETADGFRALEALLIPAGMKSPTPEPQTADTSGMTPMERLKHFNNQAAQSGQRH